MLHRFGLCTVLCVSLAACAPAKSEHPLPNLANDAGLQYPDLPTTYQDMGYPTPDTFAPAPDSSAPLPDSSAPLPDGSEPAPDGAQPLADGPVPPHDGSLPAPDSTPPQADLGDSCANGVKDVNEADVDCGGACAAKCDQAKACVVDADCASETCQDKLCVVCITTAPFLSGDGCDRYSTTTNVELNGNVLGLMCHNNITDRSYASNISFAGGVTLSGEGCHPSESLAHLEIDPARGLIRLSCDGMTDASITRMIKVSGATIKLSGCSSQHLITNVRKVDSDTLSISCVDTWTDNTLTGSVSFEPLTSCE